MNANSTTIRKAVNRVVLNDWYAQPVHCPFCGVAIMPSEETWCKHLLYAIVGGNFAFRSARFNAQLPGEADDLGPEFSLKDRGSMGAPISVAKDVLETMPNGTEFEICDPADSTFLGFAVLESELCGWEREHKSPYTPDPTTVEESK